MKNLKILAILLSALLISCNNESQKPIKVKLRDDANIQDKEQKNVTNTLRILIAPVISPKESMILYHQFVDYLWEKTNMEMTQILKKNYAEANEAIKNQQCDIALICTGAYVLSKKELPAEILVIPVVKKKIVYNSYIIANINSNIEIFDDLEGKTFAFTDPLSLTGYHYVRHLLWAKKTNTNNYFKSTIYTNSHDISIEAVAQGIVDVASIDSLIYDDLKDKKNPYVLKTKIIKVSEDFGIPPILIRKDLDIKIKNKIRNILLGMHNDPKGREILKKLSIDSFTVGNEKIYESAEKILILK